MTLLRCQNRFEVRNEWLSATENIGQVFLTSGFAEARNAVDSAAQKFLHVRRRHMENVSTELEAC